MELSWLMKLRIAVVVAAGAIVIGVLAWPLAAPSDPLGAVRVSNVSLGAAATLVLLVFACGCAAYFLAWPYGREIGVLAAPSGLAVWALRSGSMAGLIQLNPTLPQRQALFAALKWEPAFWLLVVAAGFAGVLLGQKIRARPGPTNEQQQPNSKSNKYLNTVIAAVIGLVASVLLAHCCIRIFARNVQIGVAVAQPAVTQVAFAVLVSFGLAAFAVKAFLNLSYIWSTIASAFVTAFAINTYLKQDVFEHFAQGCPATFFPNVVVSILPVQMVAFGVLGSIAGYWLAVRYDYWRKHGSK